MTGKPSRSVSGVLTRPNPSRGSTEPSGGYRDPKDPVEPEDFRESKDLGGISVKGDVKGLEFLSRSDWVFPKFPEFSKLPRVLEDPLNLPEGSEIPNIPQNPRTFENTKMSAEFLPSATLEGQGLL